MEHRRWRIEYNFDLKSKIKKIPKNVQTIIKKAIEERLTTYPYEYGKPLQNNLKGFFRIRVGAYRIIYKILDKEIVVLIIEIDHRKSVYD